MDFRLNCGSTLTELVLAKYVNSSYCLVPSLHLPSYPSVEFFNSFPVAMGRVIPMGTGPQYYLSLYEDFRE